MIHDLFKFSLIDDSLIALNMNDQLLLFNIYWYASALISSISILVHLVNNDSRTNKFATSTHYLNQSHTVFAPVSACSCLICDPL